MGVYSSINIDEINEILSHYELGKAVSYNPTLEGISNSNYHVVLENQNLSIMSKELHIEKNCPTLILECDEEKTKIMLDNLLSNAIKFSPQGGCIRFCVVHADQTIQFDVVDSGVGVLDTDHERIFEPFYQGQGVPDSPIKGTGLGLSIARGYALAHGGNIETIARPNGACFRLTLPIHDLERTV